MNYSRQLRFTAMLTALIYVPVNHFGFAALPTEPVRTESVQVKPFGAESMRLPVKFGEVVESHSGVNGNVIVIQDAHAIPDAQKNIANVIKYLQQEYGVGAVALEGASGDLDPQIFRSFPDKKLLREVLKGYMDAGEISGGTAAAIFDGTSTKYQGVENWDVYEEGLGLYLSAMGKEADLSQKLNTLRLTLNAEKEKIYPKSLLEVDQKVEKFYENAAQLTDLIKVLGSIQAPKVGSELEALWKEVQKSHEPGATGHESKDVEVRQLASQVEKVLNSPGAVKAFNLRKQEWMTGEISPEAFALHLKEWADQSGLNLEMSSDLHGMVRDQQNLKALEGTKLFRDLEIYIREVKEYLARRQQTDVSTSAVNFEKSAIQTLDERTNSLRILTKLSKLELSREEWKKLSGGLIFKSIAALGLKQDDLVFHLAFYLNAEERDQIFFDNLKEPALNSRPTVIVAGGFHAEGLTSRLKESGMGYALVMPKINHIPENMTYRSQMRGEVSWKDYFEVENGRIHLYKAFVRAVRDKLMDRIKDGELSDSGLQILKAWRDQIIRDLSDMGKVERAGWYTRFMDEVIDETLKHTSSDKLMGKVDNFIRGLRGLEKNNQIDQAHIEQLLKANMIPSGVNGGQMLNLSGNLSGNDELQGLAEKAVTAKLLRLNNRVFDLTEPKVGEVITQAAYKPLITEVTPAEVATFGKGRSEARAEVKQLFGETIKFMFRPSVTSQGSNTGEFFDLTTNYRRGLIASAAIAVLPVIWGVGLMAASLIGAFFAPWVIVASITPLSILPLVFLIQTYIAGNNVVSLVESGRFQPELTDSKNVKVGDAILFGITDSRPEGLDVGLVLNPNAKGGVLIVNHLGSVELVPANYVQFKLTGRSEARVHAPAIALNVVSALLEPDQLTYQDKTDTYGKKINLTKAEFDSLKNRSGYFSRASNAPFGLVSVYVDGQSVGKASRNALAGALSKIYGSDWDGKTGVAESTVANVVRRVVSWNSTDTDMGSMDPWGLFGAFGGAVIGLVSIALAIVGSPLLILNGLFAIKRQGQVKAILSDIAQKRAREVAEVRSEALDFTGVIGQIQKIDEEIRDLINADAEKNAARLVALKQQRNEILTTSAKQGANPANDWIAVMDESVKVNDPAAGIVAADVLTAIGKPAESLIRQTIQERSTSIDRRFVGYLAGVLVRIDATRSEARELKLTVPIAEKYPVGDSSRAMEYVSPGSKSSSTHFGMKVKGDGAKNFAAALMGKSVDELKDHEVYRLGWVDSNTKDRETKALFLYNKTTNQVIVLSSSVDPDSMRALPLIISRLSKTPDLTPISLLENKTPTDFVVFGLEGSETYNQDARSIEINLSGAEGAQERRFKAFATTYIHDVLNSPQSQLGESTTIDAAKVATTDLVGMGLIRNIANLAEGQEVESAQIIFSRQTQLFGQTEEGKFEVNNIYGMVVRIKGNADPVLIKFGSVGEQSFKEKLMNMKQTRPGAYGDARNYRSEKSFPNVTLETPVIASPNAEVHLRYNSKIGESYLEGKFAGHIEPLIVVLETTTRSEARVFLVEDVTARPDLKEGKSSVYEMPVNKIHDFLNELNIQDTYRIVPGSQAVVLVDDQTGRIEKILIQLKGSEQPFELKEISANAKYENGQLAIQRIITPEQVLSDFNKLNDSFVAEHRIKPVLDKVAAALTENNYKQAWDLLAQAQAMVTRDYNIFGLTRSVADMGEIPKTSDLIQMLMDGRETEVEAIRDDLDRAQQPMRDYFYPVKAVTRLRSDLAELLEQTGQSLFQPKDERQVLEEAADIMRRYGGEPDRYDPETIFPEKIGGRTSLNLQEMIQREYEGTGKSLTSEILRHIDRVMNQMEMVGRKPVLNEAANKRWSELQAASIANSIAAMERGETPPSAYETEMERFVAETRKEISGMLSMSRETFEDRLINEKTVSRNKPINDLDLVHEVVRLSLAGSSFSGTPQELENRLTFLFDSATAKNMITMVSLKNGKILMNSGKVFEMFDSLGRLQVAAQIQKKYPTREAQLEALDKILKDVDFAKEMAKWINDGYYRGMGKEAPEFILATDSADQIREKIAMNLAGFYALESGLGVISEQTGKTVMELTDQLNDGKLPESQMLLLARFSNATWKASQPFRDLQRIERETFRPAASLTDDELKKDFQQIRDAAQKLAERLNTYFNNGTDEVRRSEARKTDEEVQQLAQTVTVRSIGSIRVSPEETSMASESQELFRQDPVLWYGRYGIGGKVDRVRQLGQPKISTEIQEEVVSAATKVLLDRLLEVAPGISAADQRRVLALIAIDKGTLGYDGDPKDGGDFLYTPIASVRSEARESEDVLKERARVYASKFLRGLDSYAFPSAQILSYIEKEVPVEVGAEFVAAIEELGSKADALINGATDQANAKAQLSTALAASDGDSLGVQKAKAILALESREGATAFKNSNGWVSIMNSTLLPAIRAYFDPAIPVRMTPVQYEPGMKETLISLLNEIANAIEPLSNMTEGVTYLPYSFKAKADATRERLNKSLPLDFALEEISKALNVEIGIGYGASSAAGIEAAKSRIAPQNVLRISFLEKLNQITGRSEARELVTSAKELAPFQELVLARLQTGKFHKAYYEAYVKALVSLRKIFDSPEQIEKVMDALQDLSVKQIIQRGSENWQGKHFWDSIPELAAVIDNLDDLSNYGKRAIDKKMWRFNMGELLSAIKAEKTARSEAPSQVIPAALAEAHKVAEHVVQVIVGDVVIDVPVTAREVDGVLKAGMSIESFTQLLQAAAEKSINGLNVNGLVIDKETALKAVAAFVAQFTTLAKGNAEYSNLGVAFAFEARDGVAFQDVLRELGSLLSVSVGKFFMQKSTGMQLGQFMRDAGFAFETVRDFQNFKGSPAISNETVPVVHDGRVGVRADLVNPLIAEIGVNAQDVNDQVYLEKIEMQVQILAALVVARNTTKGVLDKKQALADLAQILFGQNVLTLNPETIVEIDKNGNVTILRRGLMQMIETLFKAQAAVAQAA